MSELGEPGKLARLVANPRNKWFMIVFWVALFAACGMPAGSLSKAQENDVSAWLPGDAESTRAIEQQEKFVSPDQIPIVAVYARGGSEITEADKEAPISTT